MKAFIISGAFILMAGSLFAQHNNVHVGLKGGLNISNIASSPNAGYNAKAGIHAGGLAHIHLNKQWAIQPEIMYSGQGAQNNNVKTRLHYVNVPVQLQYMFDKGFRIQTGPQLGMLAAANVQTGNVKTDVKNSFKTAELGWTVGASYVGKAGLGVDARYNYGITNMNDASSVNLYNRNIQVGLFYVFKHKY